MDLDISSNGSVMNQPSDIKAKSPKKFQEPAMGNSAKGGAKGVLIVSKPGNTDYQCVECTMVFQKEAQLRTHVR